MGPPNWTWERLVAGSDRTTPQEILAGLKLEPWFSAGGSGGSLSLQVVNGLGEINTADFRARAVRGHG